jgi:hypothetical protein
MMEGKTVLAIAHRLSTIARMDRIVVIDGGASSRTGPTTRSSPRAASTPGSGAASPAASSPSTTPTALRLRGGRRVSDRTDIPVTPPKPWVERLGSLNKPFDDRPVPPPPGTLWAFFAWCLRGSFPILTVAALVSVLAGTAEVSRPCCWAP